MERSNKTKDNGQTLLMENGPYAITPKCIWLEFYPDGPNCAALFTEIKFNCKKSKNNKCYMSKDNLRKSVGLSDRSYREAIARLINSGLIINKTPRQTKGSGFTCTYIIDNSIFKNLVLKWSIKEDDENDSNNNLDEEDIDIIDENDYDDKIDINDLRNEIGSKLLLLSDNDKKLLREKIILNKLSIDYKKEGNKKDLFKFIKIINEFSYEK